MTIKRIICLLLAVCLLFCLGACASESAKVNEKESTASNTPPAAPANTTEPAASPAMEAEVKRQDGERFEAVIMLEGMEETVQYEHIVNEALGFEMDYDWESFVRDSGSDRERFISIWDDPDQPENYLEVSFSTESADTAAVSVREALSQEYELYEETRVLGRAGSCLYIEASELKGTGSIADQLQAVYILPASDGCRVAAAHFSIEAAEGFGRRFSYMMHTLEVIDRSGESIFSDEQALSAIRNYCFSSNPDLEGMIRAEEYPLYWEIVSSDEQQIVVLFRSYTGAQVRYYIDRASGDTYVTEFVPGVTPEEERTEESFNLRNYY